MKNKLGSMKKIQVIIAFVLIVVIVGTTVGYQLPAFSVSAAVMYVEEVYFSKIPFDFNL